MDLATKIDMGYLERKQGTDGTDDAIIERLRRTLLRKLGDEMASVRAGRLKLRGRGNPLGLGAG